MGNLNQQIRGQAKLDSRRFSKGTICRIVQGDAKRRNKVMDVINRYSLAPPGVAFIRFTDDLFMAYCTLSGRCMVIPLTEYRRLEDLLDDIDASVTTVNDQNISLQALDQETNLYSNLIKFLRQEMIMVRIPINKGRPNPLINDVLIETIDLSQTIDGYLVDRDTYTDGTASPSLGDK